jgi:hypothetical protein
LRHEAPLPHAIPQAPQLVGSCIVLTHPAPQSVRPPEQAQSPAEQTLPAPHDTPHCPQLTTLAARSTHPAPQSVRPVAQPVASPPSGELASSQAAAATAKQKPKTIELETRIRATDHSFRMNSESPSSWVSLPGAPPPPTCQSRTALQGRRLNNSCPSAPGASDRVPTSTRPHVRAGRFVHMSGQCAQTSYVVHFWVGSHHCGAGKPALVTVQDLLRFHRLTPPWKLFSKNTPSPPSSR